MPPTLGVAGIPNQDAPSSEHSKNTVPDALAAADGLALGLVEAEPVAEADALGDTLADGDSDGLPVAEADADGETDADGD